MRRNKKGNLPTCLSMSPQTKYRDDDDERWKGAQLADARQGIYWGKYGLKLKEDRDDETPTQTAPTNS